MIMIIIIIINDNDNNNNNNNPNNNNNNNTAHSHFYLEYYVQSLKDGKIDDFVHIKGCRMGRSDKVSLWHVALLINTRFRFLF